MSRQVSSARAGYSGKRAFDLLLVGVAALPVAIVAAICAAAVRVTSGSPVLFTQERVGLNGRPFTMLKFRTMLRGDNPIIPDAAVITPVGSVLRRLSLDELPQVMNIVRGEMSVVGPRPTLAYQVARYDDRQRRRLSVRPGLTGLAQVRGRNRVAWADRIEHDLEYIETQSVWLDLRILWSTLAAVLRGAGVEGHPSDDPLAQS